MPSFSSKITRLEKIARVENFNKDGGGSIIRTFYVEPYTAHKTLLTALRGTLYSNAGVMTRVRPHNDPLYPQYYCFETTCVPFSPDAVRGGARTGFDNTSYDTKPFCNGQWTQCQNALSKLDDFDGTNLIDNVTAAQINAGGVDYSGQADGFNATGHCGAYVTAIYYPLIFQKGIVDGYGSAGFVQGTSVDAFDFVDPVWTQEVVSTQTGRNLFFLAPTLGPFQTRARNGLLGGLSDTFAKPEIVWHLSIRRLMVPFLPQLTFGILQNTINQGQESIGSGSLGGIVGPDGTMRFDTAPNQLQMGPDGTTWYDITLNFSFRKIYDTFYDKGNDTGVVDISTAFSKGWIGWNFHFGVPTNRITGIQVNEPCAYYPVVWNEGLFQYFGQNHPLYLQDGQLQDQYTSAGGTGAFQGNISKDPFLNGFIAGQ